MKADELYTLLNDLPDDYVTQAAGTHRQSHRIFRVVIPALAACITLLFTAAVYPKLRAQIPDRREDSVSTETTAAVTTESTAAEQTPAVTTASQTAKATGTVTKVPKTTQMTAAGTADTQPEPTAAVTGKTSAEQGTHITEKVQATDTVRTTVTTKNTGSPVEAEESEPQTVPYLVSKTRTTVPRNSYQETPVTVPGEEIITGTDLPTTQPWSPSGGSPSTGPFFETVPGTELPTEQTTSVCVIIVPVTTTTQPNPQQEQESVKKPEPPETEWDGNILRITPKKAYQDAALLYISTDRNGILHLTLLCLNGDVPEEDTVQISLELPAGFIGQITETDAQIRETANPALFEKASGRTPVLYSQTEKGG